MLRFVVTLVVVALVPLPSLAGGGIPAAELAEVDSHALEELRATEFEVFLAEVALHAARQAEQVAQDELRDARRSLQGEVLDLKAARAEDRAARAGDDGARRTAANASVHQATNSKAGNDLLIEWKEKALRASRLAAEHARLRQQLAVARRDLARARALQSAQTPSATKHPIAPYEKEAMQLQRSYDSALAKAEKATTEVNRLADRWVRQAAP